MDGVADFDLVDTDDATSLFSCNDWTGSNPWGVKTIVRQLKLGRPKIDASRFDPTSGPGTLTPFDRDAAVVMTWNQVFLPPDTGATYDALEGAMGAFQRYLRMGGVIRCTPKGSLNTRWYDFEPPDDLPGLFGDDDADAYRSVTTLAFPEGLPVMVLRQPYARWATLDPAVNQAANPTLLISSAVAGRPDNWTWSSTTNISGESIDRAGEAYKFAIATTGSRILRNDSVTAAPGDVWSAQLVFPWASDSITAKCRVTIEFLDAGNAVLATANGAWTTLSTGRPVWPGRPLTITSAAAPGSTAKVRMGLEFGNAAATSVNVYLTLGQVEKAATPSLFRCGAQTVPNDAAGSGGRAIVLYSIGNLPSPAALRAKWDSGSKGVQLIVSKLSSRGVAGRNYLTDYLNTSKLIQLESATMGTDTSSVADANASGGNVAEVAAAGTSQPTMTRRTRSAATTVLDSRRGTWDVLLRAKIMGADAHYIGWRGGPNASDPGTYSLPEVFVDRTGASSFDYEDIPLGRIYVPDSATALSQITHEVWSRRVAGGAGAALRLDHLFFLPADDRSYQTVLSEPNVASEMWTGDKLVLATKPTGASPAPYNHTYTLGDVTSKVGEIVLSSQYQMGATPPAAGVAWGASRHVLTLDASLQQNDMSGTKIGEFLIYNVTDDVLVAKVNLIPTVGEQYTRKPFTISFDGAGGKAYSAQIHYTAATTAGWKITGISITHQGGPSAASGEYFRADASRKPPLCEHLDSSLSAVEILGSAGKTPLWLEPGLNVVATIPGDIALPGYDRAVSVLGRTLTEQASYAPWQFG